jgi:hypothetical protein
MSEEEGAMYTDGRQETDEPSGSNPFEKSGAARALRRLSAVSPPETFHRLRKRAAVLQGTRMLFESQVFGFWIVLNALLRILLGSHATSHATNRAVVLRRDGK